MRVYIQPYSILAVIFFTVIFYTGVKLIFFNGATISTKSGRFVLINVKNDISRVLHKEVIERELLNSGFKISFSEYYKRYQIIRYTLFFILLVSSASEFFNSSISLSSICIICFLFLISVPKIKIGKYWTIFGQVIKFLDGNYKKKQDIELSSIIIQLQNIAVSQKDEPTTLTHMLSKVVRFAKYTRTAFIKMISYIDQGKEENARKSFIEEIDTSLGKDLAYILIELDRVEPSEVVNQLKLLEDRVRKESLADKNNSEEFYSNIMYTIPTILCFVVLLNFLIIVLNLVTSSTLNF